MSRLLVFLLLLFAAIPPAIAAPATLSCAYKDKNGAIVRQTFTWDAGARLFDGHRIGDVWQEGDARIGLRSTDISVIRETSKPAKDGHMVRYTLSIDDYGVYRETEDSQIVAVGECNKVTSNDGYDLPPAAPVRSTADHSAVDTKTAPGQEVPMQTAIIKLIGAASIMRAIKPKDDAERRKIDEALAALESAIAELQRRNAPP